MGQIDLIVISKIRHYNNNYAYLLVVIDCFSRYAYIEPLRHKTAEETLEAFQQIIKRAGTLPRLVQSDDGKEFLGSFRCYLKKNYVVYFSTSQDVKSAIVERFNRTLQNRIYMYLTSANTLRYIDVLQEILHSYNKSKHRTLGISPAEVNPLNAQELWNKQYRNYLYTKKTKFPFAVGDKVRITKYRKTFQRGYESQWETEVFQVIYVLRTFPVTYVLIDRNNEILQGSFYSEELIKVRDS